MGQSQATPTGSTNAHQQQATPARHHQPFPSDASQHPTSAAFAAAADFVDPRGERLLTEAGFSQLFGRPTPLLPTRLLRAAWRAVAKPGREFLTAGDLAELHDGLAGGGPEALRRLLVALLTEVSATTATAKVVEVAEAVLEAAWLRSEFSDANQLRAAFVRLLRPPPPLEDDDDDKDCAAAIEEVARQALRHAPQLMAEPAAAIVACLRAPTPLLALPPPLTPATPSGVLDDGEVWLAWTLACQLPPIFAAGMATAQLLYDTCRELRSPSQLAQLVFDYGGPTLLLVTAAGDVPGAEARLFCVAADRGFREAWDAYGDADSRLTQLLPDLRVLLSGSALFYANFKASVGRKGISVGRNPAQASPVLLIDPELDTVSVFGVPAKLTRLRALGLGDPGLVERLRAERERDARLVAIARDRKLRLRQEGVDNSAAWEQNVDRQLLEWGGARNPGNNAQAIEGREAELGMGNSSDAGPSRLLKPEF